MDNQKMIDNLKLFISEQNIRKSEQINDADYSQFRGKSLADVKEYMKFYNENYYNYKSPFYDYEGNIKPWTARKIVETLFEYRNIPEEFKKEREKLLNFHKKLCEINKQDGGFDRVFRYREMKPYLEKEYLTYDPNLKRKIIFKHSYKDYEWGWSLERVKESLLWYNEELNPLYWTKWVKEKTKKYSKECANNFIEYVNSQEEKDFNLFENKLKEFKTSIDLETDKQSERDYWDRLSKSTRELKPEYKMKPSGRDYGLLFE